MKKVAVVIVSYNEKEVIEDTIKACQKLSYPNKTIIVGDDSNDGTTYPLLKRIAAQNGCKRIRKEPFIDHERTEVLESQEFVVFHRNHNLGFKAGSLKELEYYLQARGYEYMYLIDADWRPQKDAIERSLEVLEANPAIAFVQTRRVHHPGNMNFLQRCLSLNEDGCSLVDFQGRQALGDIILFGGCAALFRMRPLYEIQGFKPGHLTEDIDITNRFYLAGYKGVYLDTVSNEGEVPPTYTAYRKQQDHWATGAAHTLRDYFVPILTSTKMSIREKFSMLRQNAYFTNALAIELSIVLSFLSVALVTFGGTENYSAVLYQHYIQRIGIAYSIILYLALASNYLMPVITIIKRKRYRDLVCVPYATWLSWSIIHTYFWANIKGLLRIRQDWFHTPKTNRKTRKIAAKQAHHLKFANAATLVILIAIYSMEWYAHGWLDPYAFFWVPAFIIGTVFS